MHLYPLSFIPITKTMVWGSESWILSCRPNEMSVIENGPCAGMTLEDYINQNRTATLGTRLGAVSRFPLLLKIIDARDALSVQVHPDDVYAAQHSSHDTGKSEMWYIIKPPDDGHLIIGLKDGITRADFKRAYDENRVEDCLNRLKVQAGDMIDIPAGLVHALTPGTVIAEVQQNSDTTYRLYDYNRMGLDGNPRELHVEHGLNVSDFDGRLPKAVVPSVCNPYFQVEHITLEGTQHFFSDPGALTLFINLENKTAMFIPARLGAFSLFHETRTGLLKITVPK